MARTYVVTSEESARAAMSDINRTIAKELSKIDGLTLGGLYAGGLKVEALAKRYVPVEYGNLRASGYTRRIETKSAQGIEVGFSASYAVYVHENLEAKWRGKPRASGIGAYWGPNGRPRFLVSALEELKDEIVRTAAQRAKQADKGNVR